MSHQMSDPGFSPIESTEYSRPNTRYNIDKFTINLQGRYPSKIKLLIPRQTSTIPSQFHSTSHSPEQRMTESERYAQIEREASAEVEEQNRQARRQTSQLGGENETRDEEGHSRGEPEKRSDSTAASGTLPADSPFVTPEDPGGEKNVHSDTGHRGDASSQTSLLSSESNGQNTTIQEIDLETPARSNPMVTPRHLQLGHVDTPASAVSRPESLAWEHMGQRESLEGTGPRNPNTSRTFMELDVTPDSGKILEKFLVTTVIKALTNACADAKEGNEEPNITFQLFDDQDTLNQHAFTVETRRILKKLVIERIAAVEMSGMSADQRANDWGKEISENYPTLIGEERLSNDGNTCMAILGLLHAMYGRSMDVADIQLPELVIMAMDRLHAKIEKAREACIGVYELEDLDSHLNCTALVGNQYVANPLMLFTALIDVWGIIGTYVDLQRKQRDLMRTLIGELDNIEDKLKDCYIEASLNGREASESEGLLCCEHYKVTLDRLLAAANNETLRTAEEVLEQLGKIYDFRVIRITTWTQMAGYLVSQEDFWGNSPAFFIIHPIEANDQGLIDHTRLVMNTKTEIQRSVNCALTVRIPTRPRRQGPTLLQHLSASRSYSPSTGSMTHIIQNLGGSRGENTNSVSQTSGAVNRVLTTGVEDYPYHSRDNTQALSPVPTASEASPVLAQVSHSIGENLITVDTSRPPPRAGGQPTGPLASVSAGRNVVRFNLPEVSSQDNIASRPSGGTGRSDSAATQRPAGPEGRSRSDGRGRRDPPYPGDSGDESDQSDSSRPGRGGGPPDRNRNERRGGDERAEDNERKKQVLVKRIQRTVERTKRRAEDDSITEPKVLQTDKETLGDLLKQVRKSEDHGTEFEIIETCLGRYHPDTVVNEALDIVMKRMGDLEKARRTQERKEESMTQSAAKAVGQVNMPKLTGHSTYLQWKEYVLTFIRQSGLTSDSNLNLCQAILDATSAEYKTQVEQAGNSVTRIMDSLSRIFDDSLVEKICGSRGDCYLISTLPRPNYREQTQLMKSINVIKTFIRLFIKFSFKPDITNHHVDVLESLVFPSQELAAYNKKKVVLEKMENRQDFLDNVARGDEDISMVGQRGNVKGNHSLLYDSTMDNQDQSFVAEATTVNIENLMARRRQVPVLTVGERLDFFYHYILVYEQELSNEKVRKEGKVGENKKKTESNYFYHEEEYDSQLPENAYVVTSRSFRKENNKRPLLKCPFKSESHGHYLRDGSGFFCDHFDQLPLMKRKEWTRKNNTCEVCLRPAHAPGIKCPLHGKQCKYCGSVDHSWKLCSQIDDVMEKKREERREREKDQQAHVMDETEGEEEIGGNTIFDPDDPQYSYVMTENHAGLDLDEFEESLRRENDYEEGKPILTPEQRVLQNEAIERMREAIKVSQKSGLTEAQKKDMERLAAAAASEWNDNDKTEGTPDLQAFVMQLVEEELEIPQEVKAAIKHLRKVVRNKKNHITAGEIRDWVSSDYPGTDVLSKDASLTSHLRIGPRSEGKLGEMFQKIYDISTKCGDASGRSLMQVVPVAVSVDPNKFPDKTSHFEDTELFEHQGKTFLRCFALLDSGASCIFGSPEILATLDHDPYEQFNATVSTGAGLVQHESKTFPALFLVKGGETSSIMRCGVATMAAPLTKQAGVPEFVRNIVREEFKFTEELESRMIWSETFKRPHFLVGLNTREGTTAKINPLDFGCRPSLYNPNLSLRTCKMILSDTKEQGIIVTGSLGVKRSAYSIKDNCPGFYLQESNIRDQKLHPWQEFDPNIINELEQRKREYDLSAMMYVVDRGELDMTEETEMNAEQEQIMEYALMQINNMVDNCQNLDETGHYLREIVSKDDWSRDRPETESALMTIEQTKQVEKYLLAENGYLNPVPLCTKHENQIKEIGSKCSECVSAKDPTADQMERLKQEILDNLFAVPLGDGTFQLVQKVVKRDSSELTSHLSVSSLEESLKASEKVVRKTFGTSHLTALNSQVMKYIIQDKVRVLTPEEIDKVSRGERNIQFFCRGVVEKVKTQDNQILTSHSQPDSASTPIRMISDTKRGIRGLGGTSLSTNAPAARGNYEENDLKKKQNQYSGYCPSLYSAVLRFFTSKKSLMLDLKAAYHSIRSISKSHLTELLTFLKHRLHPENIGDFCSVWYDEVEENGTKFKMILANLVVDFGFSFASVSLMGGCLKAAEDFEAERELILEMAKECVEDDTYIDNLSLNGDNIDDLHAAKHVVIRGLKKYGLIADKEYCPHGDAEPGSKIPAGTVVYGISWDLEKDEVVCRTKLNAFGSKKGRPQGPPLHETDLSSIPITRRVTARLTSSLYCLSGRFLGPVISQSKLIFRDVVNVEGSRNIDYDISNSQPEVADQAREFWTSLGDLQSKLLPWKRSVIPDGGQMKYLVIASDASPIAVGATAHMVATDRDGTLRSNILAAKSMLNTATVPKNERVGIHLAVLLLLQITKGIAKLINKQEDFECFVLTDSVVATYMMANDFKGDSRSKCIATKIQGLLNIIGGLCPRMKIKMAWTQNGNLVCVDFLTKRQKGCPINFTNSHKYRQGPAIFTSKSDLEEFTYLEHQETSNSFRQLPEYLRKSYSHQAAVMMHCVINMDEDHPVAQTITKNNNLVSHDVSSEQTSPGAEANEAVNDHQHPPLPDDLLADLHPEHHVRALQQYSNQGDQSLLTEEIAMMYVMTRSKRREQNDEALQLDRNAPHVSNIPITINYDSKPYQIDLPGPLKLKCTIHPRDALVKKGGSHLVVSGLISNCYNHTNILQHFNPNTPIPSVFHNKQFYIETLLRFEYIHQVINFVSWMIRWNLRVKNKTKLVAVSDTDITISAWLKLLKTDQLYYELPKKHQENFHQKLGLYFCKYSSEDSQSAATLGTLNVPMLNSTSPLLIKCLLSAHKQKTALFGHDVHNGPKRTLSIACLGSFGITAPKIVKTVSYLLTRCSGCRRGSSKFYMSYVGPRWTMTSSQEKPWTHVSFDELSPISCSASRQSRALIKVYLFVFVCNATRGIQIIGSDSNTRLGLMKAVSSLRLRTNCPVKTLYCDSFATHDKVGHGDHRLDIVRHPPHCQHKNFSERSIREVRRYLRVLLGYNRKEPGRLGILNATDIMLLMDLIANTINTTPLGPESPLTAGHFIYPAIIGEIASNNNLGDVFTDFGSYKSSKTAEEILGKYQQMLTEERNKHLTYLQRQFEKTKYHQKHGEGTDILPEVNDIVLIDFEDGKKDRLGKILEISEHGTMLQVQVSGKQRAVATKNARILSLFRPADKTLVNI